MVYFIDDNKQIYQYWDMHTIWYIRDLHAFMFTYAHFLSNGISVPYAAPGIDMPVLYYE